MNIINDKQTYNVYVARKMTKLKQTWIDIQEVSLQYSLYCDLWSWSTKILSQAVLIKVESVKSQLITLIPQSILS